MRIAASHPAHVGALDVLETIEVAVGDGRPPNPLVYPHVILYGGEIVADGSMSEPNADGEHTVQLTAVGLDASGALYVRDLARFALLDRSLWIVDGAVVKKVSLEFGRPVARDDDLGRTTPVFFAVDIIRILTSPSA